MKAYSCSQAHHKLTEALNRSKSKAATIRRRGGETFSVMPQTPETSPLDIPGLSITAATRDILGAIRPRLIRFAAMRLFNHCPLQIFSSFHFHNPGPAHRPQSSRASAPSAFPTSDALIASDIQSTNILPPLGWLKCARESSMAGQTVNRSLPHSVANIFRRECGFTDNAPADRGHSRERFRYF